MRGVMILSGSGEAEGLKDCGAEVAYHRPIGT
jgi:hypothetical protein